MIGSGESAWGRSRAISQNGIPSLFPRQTSLLPKSGPRLSCRELSLLTHAHTCTHARTHTHAHTHLAPSQMSLPFTGGRFSHLFGSPSPACTLGQCVNSVSAAVMKEPLKKQKTQKVGTLSSGFSQSLQGCQGNGKLKQPSSQRTSSSASRPLGFSFLKQFRADLTCVGNGAAYGGPGLPASVTVIKTQAHRPASSRQPLTPGGSGLRLCWSPVNLALTVPRKPTSLKVI